jgi:hypothetical protein
MCELMCQYLHSSEHTTPVICTTCWSDFTLHMAGMEYITLPDSLPVQWAHSIDQRIVNCTECLWQLGDAARWTNNERSVVCFQHQLDQKLIFQLQKLFSKMYLSLHSSPPPPKCITYYPNGDKKWHKWSRETDCSAMDWRCATRKSQLNIHLLRRLM